MRTILLFTFLLHSNLQSLAQVNPCESFIRDIRPSYGSYDEYRAYKKCMLDKGMEAEKLKRFINIYNHRPFIKGKAIATLYTNEVVYIDTSFNILGNFGYDQFIVNNDEITIAKNNNMYGCVDIDGKIIVPFLYDNISYFSKGINLVYQNGKYGLINNKGKLVVPIIYKYLSLGSSSDENLIIAQINLYYGVINNKNELKIPFEYQMIEANGSHLIVTKNCKKGILNDAKILLVPIEYDDIRFLNKNIYQLQKGKKLAVHNLKTKKTSDFIFDGLSSCRDNSYLIASIDTLYYLTDTEGKIRSKKGYNFLTQVSDGTIAVNLNGMTGYLDMNESMIIPPKYNSTSGFYKERVILTDSDSTYIFDNKGRLKKSFYGIHDDVQGIDDDLFYIAENEGKGRTVGYYNRKTNFQIPPIYSKIDKWGNKFIVNKGNKSALLNKDGEIVVPFGTYDLSRNYSLDGNYLLAIRPAGLGESGEKYGLIDPDGKIILPLTYDEISGQGNGILQATKGSRFYYFDRNFKSVPKPYDISEEMKRKGISVHGFEYGLSIVYDERSQKMGLIDEKGNFIIPLKYETLSARYGIGFLVKIGNKYGLINYNDTRTSKIDYDKINAANPSLIIVERDKKFGFLDGSFKEIIPLKYDKVSEFENGVCKVTLNGKTFYINEIGQETTPCNNVE